MIAILIVLGYVLVAAVLRYILIAHDAYRVAKGKKRWFDSDQDILASSATDLPVGFLAWLWPITLIGLVVASVVFGANRLIGMFGDPVSLGERLAIVPKPVNPATQATEHGRLPHAAPRR